MWSHDLDLEAQIFRKGRGGVEVDAYGEGWRLGGGKVATGRGKIEIGV